MTEIAFVLKAVATLISTLKKTPPANGKFCKLLHLLGVFGIMTVTVLDYSS